MMFESDFRTIPYRFQPRHDYRKGLESLRKRQVKINTISPSKKKENNEDTKVTFYKWWINFCDNSSIHGLKYIGQENLHWSER